jgi:hypothetical protein
MSHEAPAACSWQESPFLSDDLFESAIIELVSVSLIAVNEENGLLMRIRLPKGGI